ncbi:MULTISPECIES: ATP-binding protein [Kamptonema]|uniref:ATP-binding protein n=1 Tax=Kamptonema TaxID=1501433 RepID=UPI0001DAD760
MTNYSADQIQILTPTEAVRKRPGMYIGTTGARGLHHLVYEVVDNSIDEAMAGYCTHIQVDINADGSVTVTDDGRGIPSDIVAKNGKSFVETVLTVLHRGEWCDRDSYKVSGGLHGVGIAVINALSEWLEVTVWRKEQIYTQRFERGIPVTELIAKPSLENRTGTSVTFKPDSQIFTTSIEFDYNTFAIHLRQIAYVNPGLTIILTDNSLEMLDSSSPRIETYCFELGIREYVAYLNSDKEPLHEEVIYIEGDRNGIQVQIAFQWYVPSEYGYDKLLGFANSIRTIDGGTHIESLKLAIPRTVSAIAHKLGKLKDADTNLGWMDGFNCGYTGIIAVKLPNPIFEGPTRTRLANLEVREFIESLVREKLTEYLEAHPDVAIAIVEQAIQAHNTAVTKRQERVLLRQQELLKD